MDIIAIDFDGTLCRDGYPDIGAPRVEVIRAAKERQNAGAKLILWTCRSGRYLEEALSWCDGMGLRFDAVNENLPEMQQLYGDDTRKVSATEYWDDRAVVPDAPSCERCANRRNGRKTRGGYSWCANLCKNFKEG